MILTSGNTMAFLPNWEQGVDISYSFQTVISTTRPGTEQRRSLLSLPKREITAEYLWKGSDCQKFEIFLHTRGENPIYVPVYTQPISVTSPTPSLQGASSIGHEYAGFYFDRTINMQHIPGSKRKFVLYDKRKNTQIEQVEDDLYTASGNYTTELTSAIVNDFTTEDTIMYPLVRCVMRDYDKTKETGDTNRYSITFEEVI